jgi:hypothetical protein
MMLATASPPPAQHCVSTIASFYKGRHLRRIARVGDYAAVDWETSESGGEGAFRLVHGRWCMLTSGGGAFDVNVLVDAGVPRRIAQQLLAQLRRTER